MINLIAAAIQSVIRPRIITVLLINSPDESLDEDAAESGGLRYRRAPNETVRAFRERAAENAQRSGKISIVFGEQRQQ
jgi:hypothetical protein